MKSLKDVYNFGKKKSRLNELRKVLKEAEEALAQQVQELGAKPITLVVLYGPPAAGKGAAKGAIGDFIGANDEKNFKDYLKGLEDKGAAQFQEEDEAMTSVTSKALAPAVFEELAARVDAGESFDAIIGEYFHVNESGQKFELNSILSKSAFEKIKGGGGAEEFAGFDNTKAFFTQARGFSKEVEGLSDDINKMMGPNDGSPTLGIRAGAASRYLTDIKKEMKSLMSGVKEIGTTAYASVYLADQAGESTANTDRIAQLGQLKGDEEFEGLKIIGIYIHQPAERTRVANLHRASTGGRRVAQSEVDRIFAAGPEVDKGGNITKKGAALEAMEAAGFDQIHLYHPPEPFDPADSKVDGRPIGNAICEPLGTGKGHLDIEGCDDEAEGPKTGARSLAGMEKYAAKQAGIDDEKISDAGGGLPKDLSGEEKEKVIAAFEKMKFSGVTVGDLEKYLKSIHPPQIRDGGEHGKVPWAGDLFLAPGRDPTAKVTVKSESVRTKKTKKGILYERWLKNAGLIKD